MWLIYRIYYSHNFYNILLEGYLFMVQIFLRGTVLCIVYVMANTADMVAVFLGYSI